MPPYTDIVYCEVLNDSFSIGITLPPKRGTVLSVYTTVQTVELYSTSTGYNRSTTSLNKYMRTEHVIGRSGMCNDNPHLGNLSKKTFLKITLLL